MPSSEPAPSAPLAAERGRLGELALLIAGQLADDPGFGATRLNKALFLTDFLHYKRLGTSVSGAAYERLSRAPAPRGIRAVLEGLVEGGDATWREEGYLGYLQRRLVAIRPPDQECFGTSELQMAAEVCAAVRGHSHLNPLGWQLAAEREEIPYASAFLASVPAVRDDIERGLALAAALGLAGAKPSGRRPAADPRHRVLRTVGYECGWPAGGARGDEVRAGVEWALARWPEGVHRIPGTRLHEVRTEWPIPALRVWFTLEDEARATVRAVDEVQPYAEEEDGSD